MPRKTLMFLICALVVPAVVSAYDLYVKSVKAPVYAMPDTASGLMVTYEKGTKLAGVENKGNWHMIRVKDGTGWVYRFLVGDKPPLNAEENDALINQYKTFSSKARRRPSSYTAAAAARGLREKRKRFAEKYNLDYKTLEKVEAVQISEAELMSFIKQGIENAHKD